MKAARKEGDIICLEYKDSGKRIVGRLIKEDRNYVEIEMPHGVYRAVPIKEIDIKHPTKVEEQTFVEGVGL